MKWGWNKTKSKSKKAPNVIKIKLIYKAFNDAKTETNQNKSSNKLKSARFVENVGIELMKLGIALIGNFISELTKNIAHINQNLEDTRWYKLSECKEAQKTKDIE